MNTSNNTLKEFLAEKITLIKEFVMKHIRIVLPVAVAVLAVIVLLVSLGAHNRKKAREEALAALEMEEEVAENTDGVIPVPTFPLEEDAYPAVNELINKYYTALAAGDMDQITKINNNIDDTETIRITETSKYIDSYQNIKIYTKIGPAEGTYLAYVYSEVKFTDYENPVPGMQAYYICVDENGNLYINDGEESDSVTNYIREVSLQDDVVDLNNEVAVAYNDMLANDEALSVFLVELTESIDTSVGESLAEAEGDVIETEPEEEEDVEEEPEVVVITVKATTTVNIRSSDSETADKKGRAAEGDIFKLIEAKGNGWSEVEYEGGSAFIKSEFLEPLTTETVSNDAQEEAEEDDNATTANQTATADSGSTTVTGTVMVKENVRIRAAASEDGEKLATAYMGQKLDMIEKMSNGWTKIKYNGKIAYVKSDYVEVQ